MKHLKSYINTNAFWTLMDQGVVSGSTLVVSILLVAYLGVDGFGVYSLYWMAVLLISGFHQALVVMPLYTLFPKMNSLEVYMNGLFREQLIFSGLSALLIMAIFSTLNALGYDVNLFHGFLVGLLTATYTIQDLLRRLLFVKSKTLEVLFVDVLNVGLLPLAFIAMWAFNSVTMNSILLVTLLFKLVSIVVAMRFLSINVSGKKAQKTIRKEHWESGKYLLASSILQWFSGNAFVLLSGMLLGPSAIGVLRIAQSILGVVNVFFLFLENRVPIQAAKVLHEGGQEAFNQFMFRESKKYLWLLMLSLLCLGVFNESITSLFYGNAMESVQWLIPTYCVLYILIYAGTMLRFTFRTLDQNKVLFYGYVVSAIVGLSCVYPMIKWWGLIGVILGLFATQVATLLTYTYHLNKRYDFI